MSVNWGKTHPIWVKPGATTPRNYQPTRYTAEDAHDNYTRRAMHTGKTIGDLMHESLELGRRIELLRDPE